MDFPVSTLSEGGVRMALVGGAGVNSFLIREDLAVIRGMPLGLPA